MPPDDASTSSSSATPGGSSSGQAGSSTTPTTTQGGADTVGPGAGGSGATTSSEVGAGGTGGAEKHACVDCADNYVGLCCETPTCVSEVKQALANPNHVIAWQDDVDCLEYDGALACAACNDLCVFPCADYFPNDYCYDNTWCE